MIGTNTCLVHSLSIIPRNIPPHDTLRMHKYTMRLPVKLKGHPEPRYNYDHCRCEFKQKLQESHGLAREHLTKKKINTSIGYYDGKENALEVHVMDKILLRDNTR